MPELHRAEHEATEVHAPLPSPEAIAALPPDGGPEFNRLIHEQSPYLLQHARNPVDWHPWGDEALDKARREDKPIFLSVGYSTCHWCHVMERESFEDPETAAVLNSRYVPIKVDREERPDIDEIYMAATQLLTGRGGWPNSLWLTPEARPFYAGTYFPPKDAYYGGQLVRQGFRTLLDQLADVWQGRPDDARSQSKRIAEAMAQQTDLASRGEGEPGRALVRGAIDRLRAGFDDERGGFHAGAPKFPPHGSLRLLLYEHARGGDDRLMEMVVTTMRAMARGGIYDQVGGGFHRYATDESWFLPHFEKMLYDNAQLARAYAEAAARTGDAELRRIAGETLGWILGEMKDPGGGFHSALDADSEGEEGRFYVWEQAEILSVLGDEAGARFCRIHGAAEGGNWFEEASRQAQPTNILHLPRGLDEAAGSEGMTPDELREWLAEAKRALYRVRFERVWPHRDDKVLTSWNGLAISALAYAGRVLDEASYVEAAREAADFLLSELLDGGRLLATWRAGKAGRNGYLDDYAFLGDGLLDLHEATGEARYLEAAARLADTIIARFAATGGGFHFTSDDHERLLFRTRDAMDKAIPSGNGVAARLFVRLAALEGVEGDIRYGEAAEGIFEAFAGLMARLPQATESLVLACAMWADAREDDGATETRGAAVQLRRHPVTIRVEEPPATLRRGELAPVALDLAIAPGFHLQSARPARDYLIATWLGLREAEGITLARVDYPPGSPAEIGDETLDVYAGTLRLVAPLDVAADAPLGERIVALVLRFQACDDRACQRPETVEIPLRVEVAGGETPS